MSQKNHQPTNPANRSSVSDLMASHQVRIIGYIRTLVADHDAAKDILQETNMTLLRKVRDFEPGTNFTAWALRIAYFEVLKWRRDKGRDRLRFSDELVESLAETGGDIAQSYDSRLDALKQCLQKLPDRQRSVVQQRYLNGIALHEIAEDLHCKPNAASQLLHRAKQNLAACITRLTSADSKSPSSS